MYVSPNTPTTASVAPNIMTLDSLSANVNCDLLFSEVLFFSRSERSAEFMIYYTLSHCIQVAYSIFFVNLVKLFNAHLVINTKPNLALNKASISRKPALPSNST